MNRAEIYNQISEKIIAKIKEGVLPWRKSWKHGLPMNFISKRPYSGINFLSLLINDFPSPYYLTFLQCKERNGLIKSGSKGELIVYWSINDVALKDEEVRRVPFIRYSHVFNLSQTNLFLDKADENIIVSCEELISSLTTQPIIKHNISKCYYSPIDDYISLPLITDFDSREEYYSSLFHEIIHWTGHTSRLGRQLDKAEEELVAEIGSAYLSAMCGISNTVLENQTAYLNGWMSRITEDSGVLIRTSIHAKNAVGFIIDSKII